MIFINEERVTLSEIRNYQGDDEVMQKLRKSYEHLQKNYYGRGILPRFKWAKGVQKINALQGRKEGKKAIYIPYREVVNSPSGSVEIIYCLSAPAKDGIRSYLPKATWFRKATTFSPDRIEEALFWYGVSSVIRTNNKIVLENLEGEAQSRADEKKKVAVLDYLVYDPDSQLAGDEKTIKELALAWGVSGADKLDGYRLKEALYNAVIAGEARGQGVDKFKEAVKGKGNYKLLALIQQKMDDGYLHYKDFEWKWGVDLAYLKRLCIVPPNEDNASKGYLINYLNTHPDDYEMVVSGGVVMATKETERRADKGVIGKDGSVVVVPEDVGKKIKDWDITKVKPGELKSMKRLTLQSKLVQISNGEFTHTNTRKLGKDEIISKLMEIISRG